MSKRLDIHITAIVPDNAFEQASILAAGKEAIDELKKNLNEAIITSGGNAESVLITTKLVNPTPGRTRTKKTASTATASTGRTARAA